MAQYFKKQTALPQDHGSWVFILSPLIVGIFAGGYFTYTTFYLIAAVMAAFMLRQPLTVAVKSFSGRRPKTDLPAALFWVLVYGLTATAALIGLFTEGFGYLLYLAVPGAPVFAWHLWLVSRRAERKQAGIEVIATGVLALSAPAAYWVGTQGYDPAGWWLWLLTWLQSAASIVYAYLRLEQRDYSPEQAAVMDRRAWWHMGSRANKYTLFNLLLSIGLGFFQFVPTWVFIPFLLQWIETLWGITHPAAGWKPVQIGMRQFIVSTAWTVLFVVFWR
ncbi:MAG TPA: YwiC-like family protein [Anaerolineales bacterium]|nr:YwiC-like family protein [Anaerolineales bacterium]HNN12877.1 YwiC-like family protein [Anaerolineales bacterium]